MDIRRASDNPPIVEHGGTCFSYHMVPKESMRDDTEGSYLEFVGEFELAPGSRLEPHRHDTHEFYYILEGQATMQISDEVADVGPGALVHIPRNVVHSIWPTDPDKPFRGLAFAVSFMPRDAALYEPVEVAARTDG
jgi:quercetin dioxygenase-like cupin family protein